MITLIARAFLRNPRRVAIILPLCTRLTRAARRFDRVMARFAAGTAPRPARTGNDVAGTDRAGARRGGPPPAALPATQGWLVTDLKHEAAFFHNRLDELLAQPEATAILAACPQAVRILRPICRMLGLRSAAIPPLPRRRKPAAQVAPAASSAIAHSPPRPPAPAYSGPPVAPGCGPPPCPHVGWPWFPHPAIRSAWPDG